MPFGLLNTKSWAAVMPGIRTRYWNAGHLLGSASIEIEFADQGTAGQPLRVLASGDIGPDAKLLQPSPEAPAGFDYVISESTYGNTNRPPTTSQDRRKRLAAQVSEAAAARGALLIPAFAVERTQELIADLIDLMERGKVPTAPIFLILPSPSVPPRSFGDMRQALIRKLISIACSVRRTCALPRPSMKASPLRS